MREHVTDEGYRYRIDAAGRTLCLRTNHPRELADALEVLARELARTREDIHAWKWAIIAAHNALQNILADCAAHERERPTKDNETLREVEAQFLAAPDDKKDDARRVAMEMFRRIGAGEMRTHELRGVADLYKVIKKRWKIQPPAGVRKRIKALNAARNDFVHFGAGNYEFDIGHYADLLFDCIKGVEYLGWGTGLVMWFGDEKDRARRALDDCLRVLTALRQEYDAD